MAPCMLASFEELADQIKNAVEDVFWVFVTACTVQDSKARNYFLKRFSWDFLQRAKARYDAYSIKGQTRHKRRFDARV